MEKIAKQIFEILSENKCTVADAEWILSSVSSVIHRTATVQSNEKSEGIFNDLVR